jgi:hypothetical protein
MVVRTKVFGLIDLLFSGVTDQDTRLKSSESVFRNALQEQNNQLCEAHSGVEYLNDAVAARLKDARSMIFIIGKLAGKV